MGVSYNFTVGYGFEVSGKKLRKVDPELFDDAGAYEVLEFTLSKEYPLLAYAWAGNAYVDGDSGYIVVINRLSHTVYGWRVEKANLNPADATEEESSQLYAAYDKFGKKSSGIGYFAASSVG